MFRISIKACARLCTVLVPAVFLCSFQPAFAQAADPYVGQMLYVPYNFTPNGWQACDGTLLSIAKNAVLFDLIGTTYGGDGINTFAVPDMRGRVPLHQGSNGSSNYVIGQMGGRENVTLTSANLPAHSHSVSHPRRSWASSAIATSAAPGWSRPGQYGAQSELCHQRAERHPGPHRHHCRGHQRRKRRQPACLAHSALHRGHLHHFAVRDLPFAKLIRHCSCLPGRQGARSGDLLPVRSRSMMKGFFSGIVIACLVLAQGAGMAAPTAADKDLAKAQLALSAGNYDDAYKQYQRIYKTSQHPLAAFSLGMFYRAGWGRPADPVEACRWFEKAVTAGQAADG